MSLLLMLGFVSALAQAELTFEKTTHDFGTFSEEDPVVTTTFKFKNSGDTPLALSIMLVIVILAFIGLLIFGLLMHVKFFIRYRSDMQQVLTVMEKISEERLWKPLFENLHIKNHGKAVFVSLFSAGHRESVQFEMKSCKLRKFCKEQPLDTRAEPTLGKEKKRMFPCSFRTFLKHFPKRRNRLRSGKHLAFFSS